MAANFQQMGAAGQIMQQQQRQQQQGQPQRPDQLGNNNATGQIQSVIFQQLSQNTGPLMGWQAAVMIQERITLIFNVSVGLRNALNFAPLLEMLNV